MNHIKHSHSLVGVTSVMFIAACAAQSPTNESSSNTAGIGSSSTTAGTGSSFTAAGAGSSSPSVFSSSQAGTGPSPSVFSSSQAGTGPASSVTLLSQPSKLATDTADGTEPITAEESAAVLSDPGAACKGWAVQAEAEQSVIEFVVDVSGSMALQTPSTFGISKWERTRAAVKAAVERLPVSFGVGMVFYPNAAVTAGTTPRPISACIDSSSDVPIATATPDQIAKIQTTLDAIEPNPLGATPTHDAYEIAVERLQGTTIAGKRHIVLITDGQPTQSKGCIGNGDVCKPEPSAPIVDAVARASTDGIRTFVVGSPGSEANACTKEDVRGWLSEAARAGNTQTSPDCSGAGPTFCHFDVSTAPDFGAALSQALQRITKSVIGCTYDVPTPPDGQEIDPSRVNLIFSDGKGDYRLILPNLPHICGRGWNYTDASQHAIQICGSSCDLLQNNPTAKLSILFGCALGSLPIL